MKKIIFTAALLMSISTSSIAGECYWVCSGGQWVPIKNGICIMPIKPISLCPL
jgi:hypothetical protein